MFRSFALLPAAGAGLQRPTPPCGCDADPVAGLKRLFVDFAQGVTVAAGRDPATRPVFLRLHGVAHGTFVVRPDLPAELRVGVFGQKSEYPAWVRFSGDVQPGTPDLRGTAGVGIKLFGVAGEKLLAPDQFAPTHDFLLQNHDVFFVDTAADMCEFTCLALNGRFDEYVAAHPATGRILADMGKVVGSVLTATYWSGLPSRFGPGRFVKYKLELEAEPGGPAEPDTADPFYLRADLADRLSRGEARFRFLAQFQTTDAAMPLDRATVRWDEAASPPLHLATLVLSRQDVTARNQVEYGENLAFNPWHALPHHEPVGSIAAARRVVYAASADVRRAVNGTPAGEPTEPRPTRAVPAARDTVVVRAAIHPAIGVARVGNSPEFVIGPEVPDPPPPPAGTYRDAAGAVKRQAARFRVYGYNAADEVVAELTSDTADIRWTAHLANRKGAWYKWGIALDIPEAAAAKLPRRNPGVAGPARSGLVIDGGPRAVRGKDVNGSSSQFTDTFLGAAVYLGELRTDAAGRLLVLGGLGKSQTPTGAKIFDEDDPFGFGNADGWTDDIADGPVTAAVTIAGRVVPVEPAWVVTAPPDYGPSLKGVRTLYDLLTDLYFEAGWLPRPAGVAFREDVEPILRRLTGLQWVNKGYAVQFGHGGPTDFADPALLAKLGHVPTVASDPHRELRRQVFNSFRDPAGADGNQLPWQWVYGDAMQIPAVNNPRQNASVSPTQYAALKAWAAGTFAAERSPDPPPAKLADVPLADRPAALDRAALEFCLADAFHPGCEVTWPIRHLSLFTKPFRIRHRPAGVPEPDYGAALTPAVALGPTGPLNAQGPGGLTRWMAVPWQADTAWCRSGYDKAYDPYVPTFWPARVPNQVLTPTAYDIVVDTNQPPARRRAAFAQRMEWVQPLQAGGKGTAVEMLAMVNGFGDMGLVEVRPGVAGDVDFPDSMLVAAFGPGVIVPPPPPDPTAGPALMAARPPVEDVGWGTAEERLAAPLPVRRRES